MRILALDTSTLVQTVAVLRGAAVLSERSQSVVRGHTSTLLETVAGCLDEAGLSLDDLDLVVVGLGPGSFTGLRIGVACAKTLAWSRSLPIVGVSSLAAMAHQRELPADTLAVTANDARKRELYAAIWRLTPDRAPEAVVDPATFAAADLAAVIAGLPLPCVGLGNGFALYPEALHNGLGQGLEVWPEAAGRPRASALADLGLRRLRSDGPDDRVTLEPRYIRKSDAELNWGKRRATKAE